MKQRERPTVGVSTANGRGRRARDHCLQEATNHDGKHPRAWCETNYYVTPRTRYETIPNSRAARSLPPTPPRTRTGTSPHPPPYPHLIVLWVPRSPVLRFPSEAQPSDQTTVPALAGRLFPPSPRPDHPNTSPAHPIEHARCSTTKHPHLPAAAPHPDKQILPRVAEGTWSADGRERSRDVVAAVGRVIALAMGLPQTLPGYGPVTRSRRCPSRSSRTAKRYCILGLRPQAEPLVSDGALMLAVRS